MAKYSELVALLEWADKKTKPAKVKWSRREKDKDVKLDLVQLLRKKKEEADLLEKFLKEQVKKEDKKEHPKHSFTFAEGVILAYMAQFIIGPMYKVFLVHLGIQ